MKPITHIRLRGLVTGRGLLGAPEGALQVANDVVSLLPGTVEPRKGYRQLQAQVAGTTAPVPGDASGVAYGDGQVVQLRKQGADHVLALHDPDAGTSSLSAPVTLHPEGGVPMRSMGRHAYACTGDGVLHVEGSTARPTGVPRALDPTATKNGTADGLAVPADSAVAYRVVFGRNVGGGVTLWGAPSGRVIGRNPDAGVRDFAIAIVRPAGVEPGDRVRLYRSDAVSPSTAAPDDELHLAFEREVPSVTPFGILDQTPPEFLGAPLYTNADTGDGLGAMGVNMPPPLQVSDVASWESRAWYACHAQRESFMLSLIGTDGLTGAFLQFVVLDADGNSTALTELEEGVDWTAYTAGTPSESIEATARSILRAINGQPTGLSGWYASGENDPPGMMELRIRDGSTGVSGVVIAASSDSTVAVRFSPRLRDDEDNRDPQVLASVSRPGILRWSKPGLPEAVPPINELPVGDAREPIIGMVALRDGIVVAKTDGLYLVYGSGGMYGVQLIDASVRMSPSARRGGRGTIQELNNEVYLHASDQHVYACSASGARAVDTDIQDLLRHRVALFAAVDERDGLYCLYMLDDYHVGNAMTDVAVYSMHARSWTRWLTAHYWAAQGPAGGLVACSNQDVLSVTRNDGKVTDYQDDGGTRTTRFLASDDGGRTQMTELYTGGEYGDEVFLVSDPTIRGTVLYPRPGDTGQRLLLHGLPFPDGSFESVSVAKCIRARVMLAPWHGGSPGGRKRFASAQLHFDRYGIERVGDGIERPAMSGLGYHTPWAQTQGADGDDGQKNILISDLELTWSEINGPWSTMYETPVQPRTVRISVPKQDQSEGMLSVGLSTKQVNGFWRLSGVTLEAEQGEQKVAR